MSAYDFRYDVESTELTGNFINSRIQQICSLEREVNCLYSRMEQISKRKFSSAEDEKFAADMIDSMENDVSLKQDEIAQLKDELKVYMNVNLL